MDPHSKYGERQSAGPPGEGSSLPGDPAQQLAAGNIDWRLLDRKQAYEQVLDSIEEKIFKGELQDGSRLPPERELAHSLGVSRSVMREALRVLQAQGVIQSATGSGPDAGTVIRATPTEALTRFLRLHVALARFPLRDVVDTRVMLERGSAQLAAERREQDHLDRMQRLLDQMAAKDVSRRTFNDRDTEFHIAIAEAGGNQLAAALTSAIRQSLRHPLLAEFEKSEKWPTIAEELRKQHNNIYEAIKDQKVVEAADRVRDHILWFFREMSSHADSTAE